MRKCIALFLLLLPGFAHAQATKDDYVIYSQYLKEFTASKKVDKIYFVVNETTIYSQLNNLSDISDIVRDLRRFLKDDKYDISGVYFRFRDFSKTIVTDTSWVLLLDQVNQKMKQNFKIENKFTPDLHAIVVDSSIYNKYFKHFKNSRQIEQNWARFHYKYPMPSALIELSEIASDGRRAVFYFSTRCGGLCGQGALVFFAKENGAWKFLYSATLWNN